MRYQDALESFILIHSLPDGYSLILPACALEDCDRILNLLRIRGLLSWQRSTITSLLLFREMAESGIILGYFIRLKLPCFLLSWDGNLLRVAIGFSCTILAIGKFALIDFRKWIWLDLFFALLLYIFFIYKRGWFFYFVAAPMAASRDAL